MERERRAMNEKGNGGNGEGYGTPRSKTEILDVLLQSLLDMNKTLRDLILKAAEESYKRGYLDGLAVGAQKTEDDTS
jgi:hypothetical protein